MLDDGDSSRLRTPQLLSVVAEPGEETIAMLGAHAVEARLREVGLYTDPRDQRGEPVAELLPAAAADLALDRGHREAGSASP